MFGPYYHFTPFILLYNPLQPLCTDMYKHDSIAYQSTITHQTLSKINANIFSCLDKKFIFISLRHLPKKRKISLFLCYRYNSVLSNIYYPHYGKFSDPRMFLTPNKSVHFSSPYILVSILSISEQMMTKLLPNFTDSWLTKLMPKTFMILLQIESLQRLHYLSQLQSIQSLQADSFPRQLTAHISIISRSQVRCSRSNHILDTRLALVSTEN